MRCFFRLSAPRSKSTTERGPADGGQAQRGPAFDVQHTSQRACRVVQHASQRQRRVGRASGACEPTGSIAGEPKPAGAAQPPANERRFALGAGPGRDRSRRSGARRSHAIFTDFASVPHTGRRFRAMHSRPGRGTGELARAGSDAPTFSGALEVAAGIGASTRASLAVMPRRWFAGKRVASAARPSATGAPGLVAGIISSTTSSGLPYRNHYTESSRRCIEALCRSAVPKHRIALLHPSAVPKRRTEHCIALLHPSAVPKHCIGSSLRGHRPEADSATPASSRELAPRK